MKILTDELPETPDKCPFADHLTTAGMQDVIWCRMTGQDCEHSGNGCPYLKKAKNPCEKHGSE